VTQITFAATNSNLANASLRQYHRPSARSKPVIAVSKDRSEIIDHADLNSESLSRQLADDSHAPVASALGADAGVAVPEN